MSKLAKLFCSTCLYTSNDAKEFFKVLFVTSSLLNWIAWEQAIAKLGGVDTSQTYLLFQTLLLLFWLHSCMIWTKLTRTDVVFSRATSVVFFCAGFWIFRYAGKIPKNYMKNQHSGSFHQAKGGPQGSQGATRRVPGAAQLLAVPPALLGGSHTPWWPTLAPIYSPVEETSKQESLFPSTPRSRRNPLFFLGELIWRQNWPPVRGKWSSSSSPLHHPSMTSSLMCE